MKKINVAIIGSGYGYYVIYKALLRIKNINVVAVCSRNQNKLKNIFRNNNNIEFFNSWKKMLNKKKIDMLAIATVPSIQSKILLSNELKNYNIKYFFIEKPIAENLNNSHKIYKRFKSKKNFLVDFTFLATDIFQKYKNIINKKNIKFSKINIQWKFLAYHNKYQIKTWKTNLKLGGGIVSFYLIHLLNYLEFFFGEYKISKILNRNQNVLFFEVFSKKFNKINIEFDCNYKNKPIHKIEMKTKNSNLILQNKSNQYFKNFKIIDKNYKKIKIINQKENILKKNEDDYRIFPVYKYLISLIKKRKINNLKKGFISSKYAEQLLK